jgi:hypothetical protein
MPFLFLTPFIKWLQILLRSKNTPLLFKEINVINYIHVYPFAIEKWNNKSSHEITIIKENIN